MKEGPSQRLQLLSEHVSQQEPLVKYESLNQVLTVTLNRAKVLNSLNLHMIKNLSHNLNLMNQHQVVWFQGHGGKAFCAGGDVKVLFSPTSTILDRLTFFREEFILDFKVSQLKALQISCWDGIVMGGGVGLSVFAPIIIATQKTVFAMPQTKLGFFPDVGSTYILSRLRRKIGYYLGMTGTSLKGQDVFIAGLANYFIPSHKLPTAYQEILSAFIGKVDNPLKTVQQILKKYHCPSGKTQLQNEDQIESLFSLPSGKAIFDLASTRQDDFHSRVVKMFKQLSPVSIQLVKIIIDSAKNKTLQQCFIQDSIVSQHMVVSADFKEGVRSVLQEKGTKPKWSCASLQSVTQEEVEKYLKPIIWSQPLPLD